MIYRESRPFETNAEYVRFVNNWCKNCTRFKLHNGLFPEYPADGGCPVLDAIEIAKINVDWFPEKDIIEEVYDNVDVVSRRICKRFESI